MAITVGTFEAKTKLSELLDRVEGGEEIVITRRGKAIARVLPIVDPAKRKKVTLEEIREISRHFSSLPGAFSSSEIDDILYDEDGLPK